MWIHKPPPPHSHDNWSQQKIILLLLNSRRYQIQSSPSTTAARETNNRLTTSIERRDKSLLRLLLNNATSNPLESALFQMQHNQPGQVKRATKQILSEGILRLDSLRLQHQTPTATIHPLSWSYSIFRQSPIPFTGLWLWHMLVGRVIIITFHYTYSLPTLFKNLLLPLGLPVSYRHWAVYQGPR